MLNMFGGNMHEVGSLSENLVLNTAGKVKIRFGSKFIDLLDNKGNINVKLPKIISKVNSTSDFKSDGIYLVDNALYAYVDKTVIPILKEPLLSINNSELDDIPTEEGSGIIYTDGTWQYVPVVTLKKYKELEETVKDLSDRLEKLEEQLNK